MDSILTSIKKLLGIAENYTHFDTDIIIYINSAFSILEQLGVTSANGFYICDDSKKWADLSLDENYTSLIKSYIYFKVKLAFDPTSNSPAFIDSLNRQISELEWRLNIASYKLKDGGKDNE